jgi:hypothetical protein
MLCGHQRYCLGYWLHFFLNHFHELIHFGNRDMMVLSNQFFRYFFLQEWSSSFTSSAILGFANRLQQVSCQGIRFLNKMNYLKLLGFYGVQKRRV